MTAGGGRGDDEHSSGRAIGFLGGVVAALLVAMGAYMFTRSSDDPDRTAEINSLVAETTTTLAPTTTVLTTATSVTVAGTDSTTTTTTPPSTTTSLEVTTIAIVDCPTEIALASEIECGIVSTNVTDASWSIPGFGEGPINDINGRWQIYINPANPDVVGQSFTLTATANGDGGALVSAMHTFTVVGG